jgi:hypothetical protein
MTLAEEARYFHEALFDGPPDKVIVERYEAAHHLLFPGQASEAVARVVSRQLDVEAVEFALRRRGRCPELTRKIQILSYLVEVRAPYQDLFVATRKEPVRAYLSLAWHGVRSAWLLLRGECLVRLHGLL